MSEYRPIRCLAIANRGEAAMRCLRATKALRAAEGSELRTLALYTEADRDAPFVRHADAAVLLQARGGAVAAYLDHDVLIDAMHRGGADAVWPGWGFVAEDPLFAERVVREGLLFLGPSAETMRRLGDKIAAKQLAERLGVPVTTWSGGAVIDEQAAAQAAQVIGYPLVIKATAGGGGRGIRMVDGPEELSAAFHSAANEATNAFGDGTLFLERRVSGGRHVEVQLAADRYGQVLALGCRDCSVQRRHQKLIEETPPPGLSGARLQQLEAAAMQLARTVGYCGVCTVEFLVTPEAFYFLEINPRLQVEHGITEATVGVDLVQWQIRIARGEVLPAVPTRRPVVAIEARVCAEDPDAGFAPAPGRIARFDPPLGPGVRVDAGVVAGTTVPADFDSLIAKVIATADTREEARAQLACALRDFELVIEGGATNKGYLLELISTPDFRAARIDTGWVDRWNATRPTRDECAVEALIVAAILAYQQARDAARLNFYLDTTNISAARVPPSIGQQIDLIYRGDQYRLQVFALGSWRYRIQLNGEATTATLREDGAHTARLILGGRMLRVLHDVTETSVRVEVEGRAHRFSRQSAGHVCAGVPAIVIAIHVVPGDHVELGQSLGVLEAMKMEVGFQAPIAGTVSEVRARRGQQVAAGDVLLTIDPAPAALAMAGDGQPLRLPEEPDRLGIFFPTPLAPKPLADLAAADGADAVARREAVDAQREEIRRVLLGYDADVERGEMLLAVLDAPVPDGLSETFRSELAEIRHELIVFADIEQLFIRTPRASATGAPMPSNNARLRMYVRRMRARGAGIAPEFLELLETALRHYGISSLSPSTALERAVLRLFASQRAPELRRRLVIGVLRHLIALVRSGLDISADAPLAAALARIARMRGLVAEALADAAIEARDVIFERPLLERRAAHHTRHLQSWLLAAEGNATPPPEEVLRELADAPRAVFDRVGAWLAHADARRRAIALAAHLQRLYAPSVPARRIAFVSDDVCIESLRFPDGRVVIGAVGWRGTLQDTATQLCVATASSPSPVDALELFVCTDEAGGSPPHSEDHVPSNFPALRFTVTECRAGNGICHRTYEPSPAGSVERRDLYGLHPETAARVDLHRLAAFDLERLNSDDDVHSFFGRSRDVPGDERVFVLAQVRGRSVDDAPDIALHVAAFEHAFHAATRTLRTIIGARDPRRRLQWNRIALFVAPEMLLDSATAAEVARRLAPAARNLGLEKVVVRVHVVDPAEPQRAAQAVELVVASPTGSRMEIMWRAPQREPLRPATDYERKVVEARQRGLVYPYEIVHMLTSGVTVDLPRATFVEYDLEGAQRAAVAVPDRSYGRNSSAIVFGLISTATEKFPDGLRRVLILSDPTIGMGSLAAPECDRIIAAIDLAEQLRLPVEWVPVSSGARIAMDSGTENLDATARVVRRIVTFTEAGGVIHIIVHGVNVGAQSYFDALSTMLGHTRGVLIMTPRGSMVLTGRAALEVSGGVAAEDEVAIGGFERIMGANGEAQYYAHDLVDAYRLLYEHYAYTYVAPGESAPRWQPTADPAERSIIDTSTLVSDGDDTETVADIFDERINPDRKRPFAMRMLMQALIDADGGHLERWRAMVGAETAIVWDAHLGGYPVCVIGIESQNVPREGYRPLDGPASWNGGTLFPLSSKKVARALTASSGNRPVIILANLSGFDGSPESMRKMQLEYGAEIARAVVNFKGPLLFVVVSRYHGGAYVVFSRALNDALHAAALTGSYASVIGGGPAAAVVFAREVRGRAAADARVTALRAAARLQPTTAAQEALDRMLAEVVVEKQAELAAEFDAIHTVERARAVGSLERILPPAELRPHLIAQLAAADLPRHAAVMARVLARSAVATGQMGVQTW